MIVTRGRMVRKVLTSVIAGAAVVGSAGVLAPSPATAQIINPAQIVCQTLVPQYAGLPTTFKPFLQPLLYQWGCVSMSGEASPSVELGGEITDTARVIHTYDPHVATGSVQFRLYGPGDATCSSSPVFTTTAPLDATATATSAPFTPTTAGEYRWVADFGGDVATPPVGTPCGTLTQIVTIQRVTPVLSAVASPSVVLGGAVTDTATVTSPFSPTGTVTFELYGPNDNECVGNAVLSSTVPLTDGSATSEPFVPAVPGTYRWRTSYSGDVNHHPVAAPCNAPNQSVEVLRIPTTLTVAPTLLDLRSLGIKLGSVSARLTAGSPAVGVPGQALTFVSGGTTVCAATTDATGRAGCPVSGLTALTVALRGIKVSYGGSQTFAPSTGSGGLLSN